MIVLITIDFNKKTKEKSSQRYIIAFKVDIQCPIVTKVGFHDKNLQNEETNKCLVKDAGCQQVKCQI